MFALSSSCCSGDVWGWLASAVAARAPAPAFAPLTKLSTQCCWSSENRDICAKCKRFRGLLAFSLCKWGTRRARPRRTCRRPGGRKAERPRPCPAPCRRHRAYLLWLDCQPAQVLPRTGLLWRVVEAGPAHWQPEARTWPGSGRTPCGERCGAARPSLRSWR